MRVSWSQSTGFNRSIFAAQFLADRPLTGDEIVTQADQIFRDDEEGRPTTQQAILEQVADLEAAGPDVVTNFRRRAISSLTTSLTSKIFRELGFQGVRWLAIDVSMANDWLVHAYTARGPENNAEHIQVLVLDRDDKDRLRMRELHHDGTIHETEPFDPASSTTRST